MKPIRFPMLFVIFHPFVIATFCLIFPITVVESWGGGIGLFYVARSQDRTACIMGSVHLGQEDLYPLPDKVEQCFREAESLVLEVDPDRLETPALREKMAAVAFYPQGDRLQNHVAPATYQSAISEARALGVPPQVMENMKPWMAALTLQILALQREGLTADHGVERHFLRKRNGKPLEELETAEFQISLLSGMKEREQETFLLDTLGNLSDRSLLRSLLQAWKEGNARGIEELLMKPLKEHPEAAPIYDRLFFSRNRVMATKVEELLRNRKVTFAVIGAGHLVGENGIVELLRAKGYRVEQQR